MSLILYGSDAQTGMDAENLACDSVGLMAGVLSYRCSGFQFPPALSVARPVSEFFVTVTLVFWPPPPGTKRYHQYVKAGDRLFGVLPAWAEVVQNRALARYRSMSEEEFFDFHLPLHTKIILKCVVGAREWRQRDHEVQD